MVNGNFAKPIPLLLPLLAVGLLLLYSCHGGVRGGDDRYGPKTLVISQNNSLYVAEPIKDTVVIVDSIPFVSGDTIRLVVQQGDLLLFEDTRTHRFRDQSGPLLSSLRAYDLDAETVSAFSLRDDPGSPVEGVLLSDTGSYILRYQNSPQGKRWEIDRP